MLVHSKTIRNSNTTPSSIPYIVLTLKKMKNTNAHSVTDIIRQYLSVVHVFVLWSYYSLKPGSTWNSSNSEYIKYVCMLHNKRTLLCKRQCCNVLGSTNVSVVMPIINQHNWMIYIGYSLWGGCAIKSYKLFCIAYA